MEEKRTIAVIYKNEKALRLPVAQDNTLSLICLKEYYPAANGLVYDDENGPIGLEIKEGKILLQPGINTYHIHLATSDRANGISKVDDANQAKAERISMYRKLIEGEKINSVPSITSCHPSAPPQKKRLKISDLRNVSKVCNAVPKFKSIYIGWKHRINSEKKKYIHQKGMAKGTTKELELNMDLKYSVQDIIKTSMEQFTDSKYATFTFQHSTVCLGLFNGIEINQFPVVNGEECLWQYISDKQLQGRIHFYLLSTGNANFNEMYRKALADGLFEEEEADEENPKSEILPPEKPVVIATSQTTNNTIEQNSCDQSLDQGKLNNQNDGKVQSSENEILQYETVVVTETKSSDQLAVFKDITNEDEKSKQVTLRNLQYSKSNEILNNLNENSEAPDCVPKKSAEKNDNENFKKPVLGFKNNSVKPIFEVDRIYKKCQILYSVMRYTAHKKEIVYSEQNRTELFMYELNDGKTLPDKEEFDPLEYNYEIQSVQLGDTLIFKKYWEQLENDQLMMKYSYGQSLPTEEHSIVYNLNVTIGIYDDRVLLGIITTCIADGCDPVFSWYCDEELHKKSHLAFCIRLPPASEDHTWYCSFTCKLKGFIESKPVVIKAKAIEKSLSVQEIKKSEFVINNVLIGSGSSANVYEGQFGGSKVAVKSVKIYNKRFVKFVQREIEVLKQIDHENFIKLYAFCNTDLHVHLITEFFESDNLEDIINSQELKEKYKYDDLTKDSISLQLCKGIIHLHERVNPIIHKDIKTQNILMDKGGSIKICDFGLSKLSIMITSLQTTINSKVMGTKMYMAPEILLHKKEATIESDIWSVGCTLVEIYTEEVVWDVIAEEELIRKLSVCERPNLEKIPPAFQPIMRNCFIYDPPNYRPAIRDLGKVWNKAYLDSLRLLTST